MEIHLTPEEYVSLTKNYPVGNQLYYIWCGILGLRGIKLPLTLAGLNVKHIEKQTYKITVK